MNVTQAKIGMDVNSTDSTRLGWLINDAASIIYNDSKWWGRWLVLEPRTAERGYIQFAEDSYNVYGAGTSEANGLYTKYTGGGFSQVAYELLGEDGEVLFEMTRGPFYEYWRIVRKSDSATLYTYDDGQENLTPPETGWEAEDGASPAPTVAQSVETITAEYDIGAQELESALNAMNDDTGPFGDLVTVDKFTDGTFSILFDSVGAQDALTVSAQGIQPTSAASVLPLIEGDATTREEQLMRILAEPLIFEDSATQIANGWSMTLNANNANILRALADEQGDMSANFSVDVVSPTATVDVVARGPVILKEGSFDVAALSGITYPEIPNLDAAIIQRVDITGLTGGTITDLDSIATIDLPIDYTVFTGVQVGVSAPGKQWTLTSGTEVENPAGGIVRPDDYNETTNAKYWQVTL